MWQIGAAILSTAASLGIGALQKPKWKQHRPDLSYVNKYISNLRGDLSKRTVERNIMREGATAVGDISREQLQGIEYQAHRTGMIGTGLHAGQQQSVMQGAQRAMADVTRQAGAVTAENVARTKEAVRQAELHKEQVTAQAKADYSRAKSQWKREMWGAGLQGAVNIGMAGFQSAMQAKDATALAQAGGAGALDIGVSDASMIGPSPGVSVSLPATPQAARQALKATGAATWEGRLKALGISGDKKQQESYFYALAEAMGIADAVFNRDFSGEQNLKILSETEQFKVNTAIADTLDFAMETGAELPEISGFVNEQFSDLSALTRRDIIMEINKTISQQATEELAGERAQAAGSYLSGEVETYQPPIESAIKARDYKFLEDLMKKSMDLEGAERDNLIDYIESELTIRARKDLTHEQVDAYAMMYGFKRPVIEGIKGIIDKRILGEQRGVTAEQLYTVELREMEQALDMFLNEVKGKEDPKSAEFEAAVKKTQKILVGDSPLTPKNIDEMIITMSEAIDNLDDLTIDKMYRSVDMAGGIKRELGFTGEFATVRIKREELKALVTRNLRNMIGARAHGVQGAQLRTDEDFLRGW